MVTVPHLDSTLRESSLHSSVVRYGVHTSGLRIPWLFSGHHSINAIAKTTCWVVLDKSSCLMLRSISRLISSCCSLPCRIFPHGCIFPTVVHTYTCQAGSALPSWSIRRITWATITCAILILIFCWCQMLRKVLNADNFFIKLFKSCSLLSPAMFSIILLPQSITIAFIRAPLAIKIHSWNLVSIKWCICVIACRSGARVNTVYFL